jgi:poly [ADP-ribose] polymerase
MEQEWNNDGAKMTNIWELWHGSSCSNLLSIMSKGFIIPPSTSSNVTGRMFSNGVYASSISTKALGYSTGYWGKSSYNRYFMFVVDMAMGRYFVPPGPSNNLPKPGYDSTFAKPGLSGIQNEEMIVYRLSQVRPKYLVEFK